MMADVQATKHKVVTKILENEAYQPDSGAWCRLYNVLMKLSKSDLQMLDIFISNKNSDK